MQSFWRCGHRCIVKIGTCKCRRIRMYDFINFVQLISVVRAIQQRYVLTLMAFLALVNAHAMQTNLSMTITQMVIARDGRNETEQNHTRALQSSQVCPTDAYGIATDGDSLKDTDLHFEWSQEMQGIILSSFYWGYVLAHLPGGMLAHKYGGKYILAFGIFFSGILSLLIPVCVDNGGAHSLIAIRMLMGLCQGPIIPACMNLFTSWIPKKERCTILSLVYSGISVSPLIK